MTQAQRQSQLAAEAHAFLPATTRAFTTLSPARPARLQVCGELAALPELSAGFVAVGFSQGGQLLRAVVQRCQHLLPGKMHTLVTLGAQHQGIMEVPGCATPALNVTPSWACRAMQTMLGWGAYVPFVQRHSVQAQYWQVG